MATKFVFPRAPRIGDRLEIVSISDTKLPINLVGNSEADKRLMLIFPDQTYSGNADGETTIATITEKNLIFKFKCVSTKNMHTWILEEGFLYGKLKQLETRIATLESK